jgi:hypothetical protein
MDEAWSLRRGEVELGRIVITGGDFPWVAGRWAPTAAYAEFAPLFADILRHLGYTELEDPDEFEAGMHAFDAAVDAVEGAGIRLHRPGGSAVAMFLLYLEGDRADFRFSDHTDDDDHGGPGAPDSASRN